MTVIDLVRHAKAQRRDRWWDKPDRDRPLTEDGLAQARALVEVLIQDTPPVALYSSPYVRCVQTLEPLASRLDLPVHPDERIAEATALPPLGGDDQWLLAAWLGGRALGLVDELVTGHPEDRVVLSTHGDVTPALLALLTGRDGVAVAQVRLRKAARITLTFQAGRCVSAEPHPAPDEVVS